MGAAMRIREKASLPSLHAIVPKGYDFLREIGSLAVGRQFSPVMKVDESTMDNDDTEDVFFDERYD